MRPTKKLLYLLLVGWVVALLLGGLTAYSAAGSLELATAGWWWLMAVLLVVGAIDALVLRKTQPLDVERELPQGLAVGTRNEFTLRLSNLTLNTVNLRVTELTQDDTQIDGLPLALTLAPEETVEVKPHAYPLRRGDTTFSGVDVLIESRWGLWARRETFLEAVVVKVFPNFTAISHFELLAHGQQAGQLGIHLNQRRGEGLDFHQLREYRPGDSLRQVDWKATSRTHKPISREFQDERDQDIIFLLDNGRRMRAKDGELSHFDHCLNAFLLTAYVALRQGDAVGLQIFGSDQKWVNPVKGKNNLNTLLHQVYDLHSSVATSDYLSAAQNLMDKHRKRSLIIIVSNVNGQDNEDLLSAYALLSQNHLVMFACLREYAIDQHLETPVKDFMGALSYSSALDFQLKRQASLKRLVSSGAIVLDDMPSQLHIALVNKYLELKRSGRI
jgi:uncharacterized protein (DUF58 family)